MQTDLTEWVKSIIGNQHAFETVDSKLEEKPSSKQLKRMLLIALRCVDPDIQHRPTMGQILLMLQPHDLLLTDVRIYNMHTPHTYIFINTHTHTHICIYIHPHSYIYYIY